MALISMYQRAAARVERLRRHVDAERFPPGLSMGAARVAAWLIDWTERRPCAMWHRGMWHRGVAGLAKRLV